jgi:cysteine desulfurase
MKPIYLDYAAATPMDDAALAAMKPFFQDDFYNPSAVYQAARDVRHSLEDARAKVADVLGAKDQEIIFTAGGTEANNMAIHGVLGKYTSGHIVTTAIEHESVLEPILQYDHTLVKVQSSGIVKVADIEAAIKADTVLVSVMYANNEIGSIQPIKEIAKLIAKVRSARIKQGNNKPLYFHTDAAQAANYLNLHVSRLGIDLMTLNGGKIYSAKQSGCLYVKSRTNIASHIQGGGQESSVRSGTENVPAIHAFATMLQKVQNDRQNENVRLKKIRHKFIATLSQEKIAFTINGTLKQRLPNNLNISFPNVDGERLLMELDTKGLMVATGSACTASNDEPSHVLLAIGLTKEEASGSVRVTFGRPTTEESAVEAAQNIAETVRTHRLI